MHCNCNCTRPAIDVSNNVLCGFCWSRVMSLGKALAFVLEGADLKTTKRATAISGFFDAFEEGI